MKQYEVKQGDTLFRIAREHGFKTVNALYSHPVNTEFRQLRPNPDLIYPGDILNIPKKGEAVFSGQTYRRHVLVYDSDSSDQKESLRIALTSSSGEAWAGKKVVAKMNSQEYELELSEQGELDIPIPEDAPSEATLDVYLDGTDQPSHTFQLQLAHLDPVETLSGVQARCNNLGFDCGAVDGIMGAATRAGIKAFQAANNLSVDGEPGPKTQAALKKRYGC